VTYVIVDIYTGEQCGKPYERRLKARMQASRMNKSCCAYRFRVEERP
jgi:hypothetical protein